MPELIAKPALDVSPVELAGLTLSVADPGPITFIAPFPGQAKAVAKLLKPLGLAIPAPGSSVVKEMGRIVWTGRGQAALIGVPAPAGLEGAAAVTDQTDGWVALTLRGARAAEALARLVPINLREAAFPPGSAVRSGLNHMPLILVREAGGFLILTFRSMARTAWHELEQTLQMLDARDRMAGA